MIRRAILLSAFAALVVSGCKCSNSVVIATDAGCCSTGTGDGGGGDGDGGLDGGSDPGDAGDGTQQGGVGPGGFDLDGGVDDGGTGVGGGLGEGLKLDPNGNLVLNSGEVQLHFAWVANANTGTVSKYDTRTGKEVGRYHSVIPVDGLGAAVNVAGNKGNSPSRTAVDLYGDVWVANRAPNLQGSVTKIANDASSCIDRNGNGKIDTSVDVNGDGAIDPSAGAGEFIVPTDWTDPKQYDECILFSTPVGGSGSGVKARALAISQGIEGTAGDVWVGVHDSAEAVKLRATNGERIPVNANGDMGVPIGFGPYGAAIDRQQRLWIVSSNLSVARLALIDTIAGTLVTNALTTTVGTGAYGIAIDGKDRVWLAGWTSGPVASRYDHGPGTSATAGTWTKFDFTAAVTPVGKRFGRARGIAADDKGYIWMSADSASGSGAAQLIAFNGDTGALKPFNTPTGALDLVDATSSNTHTSIGVSLDADGHPWVNNQSGNVMRIHRDTGEVLISTQQQSGLYTYSDFTGYALRKFTAPRGTYRHTFEGCGEQTSWMQVVWSADVLQGTSLQVFVKVGNTPAELNDTSLPKYGPFTTSPTDLAAAGVPPARYLRVEFVLASTDGLSTPVLKGFNVQWNCAGSIN